MKNLFLIFLVFFGLSITSSFSQVKKGSDVPVKSYTRKDGTVVPSHYRTSPNYTNRDNFSTKGNVNPYNGKIGTVNPDNKNLEVSGLGFQEYSRTKNNSNHETFFFRYFPEKSIGYHTNLNGLGMDITYRVRNNVFGVGYTIDIDSYDFDNSIVSPNFTDFWKLIYGKRIFKNYFLKGIGGLQIERDHYVRRSRFVNRSYRTFYKGVGVFGVFGEGNLSFVPEITFDNYWGLGLGLGFALNF